MGFLPSDQLNIFWSMDLGNILPSGDSPLVPGQRYHFAHGQRSLLPLEQEILFWSQVRGGLLVPGQKNSSFTYHIMWQKCSCDQVIVAKMNTRIQSCSISSCPISCSLLVNASFKSQSLWCQGRDNILSPVVVSPGARVE